MARTSPDPIFVLRGSRDPISCVKFASSQDQSLLLLSGCTGGLVKIWDIGTRRSVLDLNGHSGQGILALEGLDNGHIISHGRDGNVQSWDLAEGRKDANASHRASSSNFCRCALLQTQGGELLAVPGGQMSEVRVLSLKDHQTVAKLQPREGHKPLGMPMCLKFLDEQRLVIGYEDGTVALWDISLSQICTEKRIHTEPVMCLECRVSSCLGVCGSSTEQLIQWSIKHQEEVSVEREVSVTNPGLASLALRPDARILASGGWDSRIRIWSWKKLKPLAVLTYHKETVNSLDFSPRTDTSGHLLAAGSKDTHISVWSLYNDHKT